MSWRRQCQRAKACSQRSAFLRYLVTGSAGFIGFHLAQRLLAEGHFVSGVDGFTNYYDVALKVARHRTLERSNAFRAHEVLLEDIDRLRVITDNDRPDVIIHLAAQAGVRYSLENPEAYITANLVGMFNVLQLAKELKVKHLLFASTSSVYGANVKMPFRENDRADHPLTLYAATKKAGEDMAHSTAHLWKVPVTAIRFFTVYGPWGRPDMALFKFVRATLAGEPIEIYGEGAMRRDFTYVGDLVEAIVQLIDCTPKEGESIGELDSLSPVAPYRVVNVAGGNPIGLTEFIDLIEATLGRPILRRLVPMQKGDVPVTWADPSLLKALTGYVPSTDLQTGVTSFVDWYLSHYNVARA